MKLVILDRDGVINEDSDAYIKSPEEWHAIPGSLEAIARLNQAGYTVVVATNQSGLARGYFTIDTLTAIHNKMLDELQQYGGMIEGIFYCPHGPQEGCNCRKPNIGLLEAIAAQLNVDLNGSFFVGDSYKDIQAARTANCVPLLVMTGKGLNTLSAHQSELTTVPVFENLAAAVDMLLDTKHP